MLDLPLSQFDLILLMHLQQRPWYGYELIQRLRSAQLPGHARPVSPSRIYHSLHKLRQFGLLETREEPQASAPARYVYRLSRKGQRYAEQGASRHLSRLYGEAREALAHYRAQFAALAALQLVRQSLTSGSQPRTGSG